MTGAESIGSNAASYRRLSCGKADSDPILLRSSHMRRLISGSLAVCTAALALLALDPKKEPAPPFKATTLDRERLSNDSLKGKVVLMQFWTTWCGYCRRDQAAVETVTREFSDQGLVVVAVSVSESRRTVENYLAQSPRSPKIVLTADTNLTALFAPDAFPMYIVLDRDGKIAGRQEGAGGAPALRSLLGKAGLKQR